MLTKKNVRVVRSSGAECFVCDERIARGDAAIEITFKLLIPVRKEMHAHGCAPALKNLLDQRIDEVSG